MGARLSRRRQSGRALMRRDGSDDRLTAIPLTSSTYVTAPSPIVHLKDRRASTTASHPRRVTVEPSPYALSGFAARIPAGFPSPADDYYAAEDSIDLNRQLIVQGHADATFLMRVSGTSMVGSGIFDGDVIMVDRALTAVVGDIVVAQLNNEFTVKRIGRVGGDLALLSENEAFEPIVLKDGDTLEIWGVVTNCIRKLRR